MLNTKEPTWMQGASLVQGTFEALELASGDAPYILEQDDLEEAAAWVIADVAIVAINRPACPESADARQARLQAIRSVPLGKLYRPILTGSRDGSIGLVDGSHRIDVFEECGFTHISALLKLDFVPAMSVSVNLNTVGESLK